MSNISANHLLIFMRNPELGKVKKRLAVSVGNEKALEVYRLLYEHTLSVAGSMPYKKIIYFSQHLDPDVSNLCRDFNLQVQSGADLGERMNSAIKNSLDNGARKVVLIGTDCPDINHQIIAEAFKGLDDNEVVLGPADDGGYYLVGMSLPRFSIFNDIPWGSKNVLTDTIDTLKKNKISFLLLGKMFDVDDFDDAVRAGFIGTTFSKR
jgi:uncharacterized protein